jgi:Protein of unknown function (DUF3533)
MILLIIGMEFSPLSSICLFSANSISANVSVCSYPIDMLPRIYRYGYGAPFFNVSQSVRTIVFGTRNRGEWETPFALDDVFNLADVD